MLKNIKRMIFSKSDSNGIVRWTYYQIHELRVKAYSVLSNNAYANRMHIRETGKALDLVNPRTFDEKLWWIKFNYHDPLMTICADKYRVREYVKECGYENILNEQYLGGIKEAKDINFDELPDKFYIKTNHGCGSNICVDKRGYNRKQIIQVLNKSLKKNYYNQSREWPYKNINPCIIVEKFIDTGNKPLLDYRFLCFSGEFKYLFVDYGTVDKKGHHKTDAKRNIYDRNYELLPYKVGRNSFEPKIAPKPSNFEDMVEIAEKLAKPFPFVRVDLYNIDGKILFGEMTFFHAGGLNIIEPQEFDISMGNAIVLPTAKV